MNYQTITINGMHDYCKWANDAFRKGVVRLNDSVSIRFKGSPIPRCIIAENYLELRWNQHVELDLPGFVDPDIKAARVYEDRLEVLFTIGGKVTVK